MKTLQIKAALSLSFLCHVAMAPAQLAAIPPAEWTTCGDLPEQLNHTACPLASATCCKQKWVPTKEYYGCCPYPNAICCGDYTCCPANTTCQNSGSKAFMTTSCVTSNGTVVGPGVDGGGQEVCKTGGPIPFSKALKNIVILGDSVSIGYTPHVADHMKAEALVQHSPWGGDGGAEETHFGWKCLDFLLSAPDGTPQRPDVLFFNFGLHNTDNRTIPGQAGPIAEYGPYLDKIANRLANLSGVKVLFGITTPNMCSKDIDDVIMSNNKIARTIMSKYAIPTVNLHSAIRDQCGSPPQQKCFGQRGCYCPHCNDVGYEWLAANVIVPAIQKILYTAPSIFEDVASSA